MCEWEDSSEQVGGLRVMCSVLPPYATTVTETKNKEVSVLISICTWWFLLGREVLRDCLLCCLFLILILLSMYWFACLTVSTFFFDRT